jgi:hypothetical protein
MGKWVVLDGEPQVVLRTGILLGHPPADEVVGLSQSFGVFV